MLKFTLVFCLLFCGLHTTAQESARYTVSFESNWTQTAHPHSSGSLPTAAHWSKLVGALHNETVTFLEMGGLASQGIEDIAELGNNTAFFSEVNTAITAGTANQIIDGPDLDTSDGTITIDDLVVSEDYSMLTLASMIAPSPDWFIAVNGIDLRDDTDNWENEIVLDVYPYDAGTDGGSDYNAPNMNTSPQEPIISLQGTLPFSSQKIGTLTISLDEILGVSDTNLVSFSMAPNPARDHVIIGNSAVLIAHVMVYNALGRLVKQHRAAPAHQITLQLGDLTSGLYLVRVTDLEGKTTTKKLIKR